MKVYMNSIKRTYHQHGLTGNHYVYGYDKDAVVEIALLIDKKEDIVYFNEKYGVYAFRIKNKIQKIKLKELYK
jgi:hypothetical protein